MEIIEKLTAEQIAKFPQFAEEWANIALSTEPADRPRAEAALIKMYTLAGKTAPEFVWCGSPISQVLARSAVNRLPASSGARGWHDHLRKDRIMVWNNIDECTSASVRELVTTNVCRIVNDRAVHTFVLVWESIKAAANDHLVAIVNDRYPTEEEEHRKVCHLAGQVGYIHMDAWAGSTADYKFFHDACGLVLQTEKYEVFWELAQSAGSVLMHGNIYYMSERPTQIHQIKLTDGTYQLHNDLGPALTYPDGWAIYCIHGVRVTEQMVMRPESITLKQIADEGNAEVRRIMMERYGYEKYLRESEAELIDCCPQDHKLKGLSTAKLWRIGEITMLDVLNSTPEPDGTIKRYVIPVDGILYDGRAGRECVAASASTWRKRGDKTELVFAQPEDYAPEFES